ncbi:MAG: AAA family ATPase [Acidobacteria bacterium]|nr:AAA family ATPase [Acidobacteriota bacterium]
MYIQRVILENLKGFKTLDFSFQRPDGRLAGWTVLTGDNGSGKTALLKAIALTLVGPDLGRVLQPALRGWIREGAERAEIAVQIKVDDYDKFTTGRRYTQPFWAELELQKNGGPEVSMKPGSKRRGKKKRGPLNGPWAENTGGWFAAGYGPFRRLYGASPEAQRLMSGPSRIARFATMFKEDATLLECEIWLKDLSHKRLERRERETRVLDQVFAILNDDFLRNGLRVERVDSDGLWLKDAAGTVLSLADMSEGYRAALALMIDILRHIEKVYGDESLIEQKGDAIVVPHPGVVLIDEIDAHLHPAWQREIGFWLKRRFPKIQFIVTTHSALVCQAADENGIFHLPPPGSDESPFQLDDEDYWNIVRAKTDDIYISPAFGLLQTRSPDAVAARQNYARLNAKKKTIGLTPEENKQLNLFERYVEPDEEP